MWVLSFLIGRNILGYIDTFLPFIILTILPYLIHIIFYNFFSYKRSFNLKNILLYQLPFIIISSTYILTLGKAESRYESFKIIKTSKYTCNDSNKTVKKYFNNFLSGKNTSYFKVVRNGYTLSYYPSENDYYEYNKGDLIKLKVKKNLFNMDVILQQHKSI